MYACVSMYTCAHVHVETWSQHQVSSLIILHQNWGMFSEFKAWWLVWLVSLLQGLQVAVTLSYRLWGSTCTTSTLSTEPSSQPVKQEFLKSHIIKIQSKALIMWGWVDSEVESTGCSFIGPEFDSQHPYSSSQPSVILFPGDPALSLSFVSTEWV